MSNLLECIVADLPSDFYPLYSQDSHGSYATLQTKISDFVGNRIVATLALRGDQIIFTSDFVTRRVYDIHDERALDSALDRCRYALMLVRRWYGSNWWFGMPTPDEYSQDYDGE